MFSKTLAGSAALSLLAGALLLTQCERSAREDPSGIPAVAESIPPPPVEAAPAPPPAVAIPPPLAPSPPRPIRTGPLFSLPTANDSLFAGAPGDFFMFVDRYTETGAVQVWQGGSYGFVRNPRKTAAGEVYTKFHEGIDIAPRQRDAKGEPQDPVLSISDGTVVYTTPPGAGSNYGNYIVVGHDCGKMAGTFYSLYAHLQRIDTKAGSPVKRGTPIGLMGHTGAGIDRRRSHVHLEICLMMSDRFEDYYRSQFKLPNGHENFNGSNLTGIDPAGFLTAAHLDPGLTPAEYIATTAPAWRCLVPNKSAAELEIVVRHPFLRKPGPPGKSWEITMDGAGVPLSVAPNAMSSPIPVVTWVKPNPGYHSWNTRNLLTGSGATAGLSPDGLRHVRLLTGDFQAPTPAPPPAPGKPAKPTPAGAATIPGAPVPSSPTSSPGRK